MELRDFELRLIFKFTRGNSGVQVRNREIAKHATRSGLLALQDHGKGCVAAFKNIRIKPLNQADKK